MKKMFIGGMVGLLFLPTLAIHAQTQVELTDQTKLEIVEAIKLQIQELLVQLIGLLQQELAQKIAEQSNTLQDVEARQTTIEKAVTQIEQNTKPLGSSIFVPSPATVEFEFALRRDGDVPPGVDANKEKSTTRLGYDLSTLLVVKDSATNCVRATITTDYPDGFSRLGGYRGNESPTVTEQTTELCARNTNVVFREMQNTGTFHLNIELEGGQSQSTTFVVLPTLTQ